MWKIKSSSGVCRRKYERVLHDHLENSAFCTQRRIRALIRFTFLSFSFCSSLSFFSSCLFRFSISVWSITYTGLRKQKKNQEE